MLERLSPRSKALRCTYARESQPRFARVLFWQARHFIQAEEAAVFDSITPHRFRCTGDLLRAGVVRPPRALCDQRWFRVPYPGGRKHRDHSRGRHQAWLWWGRREFVESTATHAGDSRTPGIGRPWLGVRMSGVSVPLVGKYTLAWLSCIVPKRQRRVRARVRSVLWLKQAAPPSRGPSQKERELKGSLQAAVVFAVQRACLIPNKTWLYHWAIRISTRQGTPEREISRAP